LKAQRSVRQARLGRPAAGCNSRNLPPDARSSRQPGKEPNRSLTIYAPADPPPDAQCELTTRRKDADFSQFIRASVLDGSWGRRPQYSGRIENVGPVMMLWTARRLGVTSYQYWADTSQVRPSLKRPLLKNLSNHGVPSFATATVGHGGKFVRSRNAVSRDRHNREPRSWPEIRIWALPWAMNGKGRISPKQPPDRLSLVLRPGDVHSGDAAHPPREMRRSCQLKAIEHLVSEGDNLGLQ